MTLGKLKKMIVEIEKNSFVNDNTEVLVENGEGHLIGFDDLYAYHDPLKNVGEIKG